MEQEFRKKVSQAQRLGFLISTPKTSITLILRDGERIKTDKRPSFLSIDIVGYIEKST